MWLEPVEGDSPTNYEAEYIADLLSVGWSLTDPL